MAANLYPADPPVYLQVAARDYPNKFKKGDIVEVYAKGTLKSDWCVPPDWVWAEITDKSKNQVNVYLSNWQIKFVHTLDAQNAKGWRYTIEVDPEVISVSEKNKSQMKQEMIDYLSPQFTDFSSLWYKCSIHDWSPTGITLDIPKPIQGNSEYDDTDPEWILMYESQWDLFRQELRHDFHDKFADVADVRRYYFNPASVDSVVASGGEWSGTHTQALNHIIDKLSE